MPIVERLAAEAGEGEVSPPTIESWYELHDVVR